jgi:hypothetical protein
MALIHHRHGKPNAPTRKIKRTDTKLPLPKVPDLDYQTLQQEVISKIRLRSASIRFWFWGPFRTTQHSDSSLKA